MEVYKINLYICIVKQLKQNNMENLKIGDKIKSFTIVDIKDAIKKRYTSNGRRIRYKTKFMLLLSDRGEERVLKVGKTNLNECEKYIAHFGNSVKYKKHSQI